MHTYTVFSVFKKIDQLMNVTRMNIKPGKLTAADKMEKLIVLVGLIVHHFFFKQMPCFSSIFSGVPVTQALRKVKWGIRCFVISFNL